MGVESLNIDLQNISKYIARNYSIWQLGFLDISQFHRFSQDRECRFAKTHIEQLWKLKLLRADLIKSKKEINIEGITHINKDEFGLNIYYDNRKIETRPDGWENALTDIDNDKIEFSIFFHPFRIYILYYLDKLTDYWSPPKHILISTDWHKKLSEDNIKHFAKSSSMPDFIDRIKYYDEVSTISILLEPWNYHYISGMLRWSFDISKEEQKRRLEEHNQLVIQFCKHVTEEQIFNIRQELCTKAELLEPNKNLHTMIRFTIGKYTLKLKGKLGGAIILLLMAEIIRTTYEKIFDKELKEEDEMGFGVMPSDLKKRLYGNTRLMDGDKKAEKNFMDQFGLDYSVKIIF